MASHCRCNEDERDAYIKEVSPAHYDGETNVELCNNCGGLITIH